MREKIKALLFDVQGTATDFHSTLCREARRITDATWTGQDSSISGALSTSRTPPRPTTPQANG